MHQEKCVDISLAVEMLYMATVPNAYDIAVIVTGDMDFMPALEKTRLLGKRTAICSFRNGINQDMLASDARIRDFDVIWLDDYIEELIVPLEPVERIGMAMYLVVYGTGTLLSMMLLYNTTIHCSKVLLQVLYTTTVKYYCIYYCTLVNWHYIIILLICVYR